MSRIYLMSAIIIINLLILLPIVSTASVISSPSINYTLQQRIHIIGKFLLTPLLGNEVLSAKVSGNSTSYDWAVGGYSTQTGHNSYTAVWHSGFSSINASDCAVSYMLNVPVSISGYLNASLYFPGFNFIPPPIQLQFNWMWIQDAVEMLPNGSIVPVLNIWFILNYPPCYAVIYIIYGGMSMSPNGPYNETVYYQNNGWVIAINGVKVAKVTDGGVTDYLSSSQEIIATDFLGLIWPWTYVSGADLSINSVSTKVYTVLPSAGIEVHTGSQNQFTLNNPYFAVPFNFYVNGKNSGLYYAKSVNVAEDYGYMAGLYPPPNDMYGGSLGSKYLVIGTNQGISLTAARLGLSYHLTDVTNTSFY
ncbi:hypothetical protein [Stygiolobus caldivivus]|uniref:Uncharacterized protein n=1 Tax=Stygiolobus caldivivus TaxID=2824673 RepID=A0A8D5U4E4_9CREN|nr:hypothetical protein [Stygiolobus caldivivus]BCU68885.1 hypothetical protein KN1_01820 [Stygiolobus caldivivus]